MADAPTRPPDFVLHTSGAAADASQQNPAPGGPSWFQQNAPAPDAAGPAPAKDWFADNAPPPPPRTWLDEAADFGKGLWSQVPGPSAITALNEAASHPIETGKAMLRNQDAVRLRAEEAFKRGDYGEGIRHTLGWLIPVIGPQIDEAGNKAGSGHLAEGLGEATGIGLNLVAPELAGRVKLPVSGSKIIPTTLTPAERAAVEFGEQRGVPIDAATATGNQFVRDIQKGVEHTPIGSVVGANARAQQAQALTRVGESLADGAHPLPVTPESAGEGVTGALNKKIGGLKSQADTAYDQFRNIEADPSNLVSVPAGTRQEPVLNVQGRPIPGQMRTVQVTRDVALQVDMRPLKEALQPVYDNMRQWMEPARRNASQGFQAMHSIINGEDFVPASVAEQGLGGLKDLARTGNPDLRNVSQGIGAFGTTRLQDAIDQAVAQAGPDALRALQRGRAAHASKMEVAAVLDQLRAEPVQAFKQLTYQKDTGIDMLRRVAQQAPGEMPKVGRAFVEDLLDTATREGGFKGAAKLQSTWENLGPQTKAILFKNPMLVENLDKFFTLAKKLAENPNPSGTALTGVAMGSGGLIIADPLLGTASVLGAGALAKLLYSPQGVKLLTKGMTIPLSNKAAAAFTAGQIIKLAGKDATPIEMPKAARSEPATPTGAVEIAQAQ